VVGRRSLSLGTVCQRPLRARLTTLTDGATTHLKPFHRISSLETQRIRLVPFKLVIQLGPRYSSFSTSFLSWIDRNLVPRRGRVKSLPKTLQARSTVKVQSAEEGQDKCGGSSLPNKYSLYPMGGVYQSQGATGWLEKSCAYPLTLSPLASLVHIHRGLIYP